MKFRKKIFYTIKRIPAMLGLTAITMSACDDKPVVIEKEPKIITQHDTVYVPKKDTIYTPTKPDTITDQDIVFFIHQSFLEPTIETLQKYAAMDSVVNIFLSPAINGEWNILLAYNISYARKNVFQPLLDVSPKIHGRGDFNFKLGEASKVPEDSLWYIQNGWTINKQK